MKAPRTAPRLVLAALALTMALTACTPQLETHGTTTAAPTTITIDPGTKPTYNTTNPTTRTNLETGQWEVGDKVKVRLFFYADGNNLSPIGTKAQTFTCETAAVPDDLTTTGTDETAPAKWTSDLPIIVAPAGATKVLAEYNYTSAPTTANVIGTEKITGKLKNSDPGATPVVKDGIITLPATGTTTLPAPTWTRESALMVVENIPAGKNAKITYTEGGSSKYVVWLNHANAPAPANFHINFPNTGNTFTLTIDGKPTPYKDVEYKAGNKFTLNASYKPGTGGGNVQTINVSYADINEDFFTTNASPNFNITGTGTTLAADNTVKAALKKLTTSGSTKKIHLTMPEVKTVEQNAFLDCAALTTISLPAATSIGWLAFRACKKLTNISLPAATSIGDAAFYNCTALTTISLPAATRIGSQAFYTCTALTSLDLTAATAITVKSDTFKEIYNNAPITLVLHSSAANAGNNMGITVEDGTGENIGKKTVAFANTVDFNDSPTAAATIDVKAVVDPSGNPITTIN